MASSLSKANAIAIYADYWKRLNAMDPFDHEEDQTVAARVLLTDIMTCLVAVNTDGTYNLNLSDPRWTITKYSSGTRPYKVKSGAAISYTFAATGGETSVSPTAPVWTAVTFPSWLTLNSGTGALTGTAPAVSSGTFNINTGGSNTNLNDMYPTTLISCKSAFGESVNGPLPMSFQVTNALASNVTSAGTGSGVHAGALVTYTVTADNSPTSFVAYDLAQLNAGTGGTVAINPATGAITGNCGSATIAGPYTIYVAAINAYGEGVDKAVVITLS